MAYATVDAAKHKAATRISSRVIAIGLCHFRQILILVVQDDGPIIRFRAVVPARNIDPLSNIVVTLGVSYSIMPRLISAGPRRFCGGLLLNNRERVDGNRTVFSSEYRVNIHLRQFLAEVRREF